MRSIGLIAVSVLATGCVLDVEIGQTLEPEPPAPPERIDRDGDGFTYDEGDCNDFDAAIGPGAWFDDVCDGKDNDCNGVVDNDPVSQHPVCAWSANFLQTLRLDVLFVIDSSQSMTQYRSRADQGAASFLQELVGPAYDTHIGVLTMDMHNPTHQGRLVEAETPSGTMASWIQGDVVPLEGAKAWMSSAILDADPLLWGEEGGRAVVDEALTVHADGANAGFLRSDADLVVIFISDQEDKSLTPSVDDFLDHLDKLKGSLSQVTIHSIVQLDDFDCDGLTMPADRGVSFIDLSEATSGTTLSVCEPEYDQYLGTVGQISADQGLESRFPLPLPAQDAESTLVKLVYPTQTERILDYDEGEYALIDGNSALLLLTDPLPPPGTQILVDYLQDY